MSDYKLEDQVGFMLRKASQRHLSIFADQISETTPTQFATLAKLHELGRVSQNELGRQTAMDAATVKGVVDRLKRRGLVDGSSDPKDSRRVVLALSEPGRHLYGELEARARDITAKTLSPLSAAEQKKLLQILAKIS